MLVKILLMSLIWFAQISLSLAAQPSAQKAQPSAQKAQPSDPRGTRKRIGSDSQTVSEATYRKLFLDYVCAHLGKDDSQVVVSRFKVWGEKPLPPGKVNFHLFQKDKGGFDRQVRLSAIASVNGVAQGEVQMTGWVDVFESVLCASRSLKKGEILKEGDVILVNRNLSQLPGNPLTDPKEALGLMVKQSIPENGSLREGMLEKPPALVKGDKVTILVERGSLRLRAPGKALERGRPGEVIKVENTMNKREIYATVMDGSTVRVDF
jgi:flagella basal body P-ring formation protein FlgA